MSSGDAGIDKKKKKKRSKNCGGAVVRVVGPMEVFEVGRGAGTHFLFKMVYWAHMSNFALS